MVDRKKGLKPFGNFEGILSKAVKKSKKSNPL